MIDDFIERKWGRRKVEFLLPELEGILKDSLGVIVYQEQVMRIANVLASYSPGRSRSAAPRDGQEECRGDGGAARPLHERRRGAGSSQGSRWRDLRPDGEVLRLRIQQIALRGLRAGGLPDRLPQDALPGRVHGRAADLGNLKARKRRQVHRRVQGDGHPCRAARRAGLRRAVHAARRCHPLRPGRGQERRRQRHRIHHQGPR